MKKNTFADFAICMAKEYEPFRRRIMERFSLSAAEVDVLMFLANNPEYNTAAQVSLAVNSLSEKGLLIRKSGENRKSVCLIPSESAAPVIAFGREMQDAFQETLFFGFSAEEKATFDALHEKMRANLENMKKSKEKGTENK